MECDIHCTKRVDGVNGGGCFDYLVKALNCISCIITNVGALCFGGLITVWVWGLTFGGGCFDGERSGCHCMIVAQG